jgi:hypothetical protein
LARANLSSSEQLGPKLRAEGLAKGLAGAGQIGWQAGPTLPGFIPSRGQVFGHPLRHLSRELADVVGHGFQAGGIVRPVHQQLALLVLEFDPVAQLQLDAGQIQFAAQTEGNAAPAPHEVLLERKAVAGLMAAIRQHLVSTRSAPSVWKGRATEQEVAGLLQALLHGLAGDRPSTDNCQRSTPQT